MAKRHSPGTLVEEVDHGGLVKISQFILDVLDTKLPDDPIRFCGNAASEIISFRPDDVLELAYMKLNSWPFAEVPFCWRRLHEDATLGKAVQTLGRMISPISHQHTSRKRRKLGSKCQLGLSELVEELDRGIVLSGVPFRAATFAKIFQMLDASLDHQLFPEAPSSYHVEAPPSLQSRYQVSKATHPLSFESFQAHLDNVTTPLVMPELLKSWRASTLWQDPSHLLNLTLGGRRLVPVEIGRSYTDEDWGQTLMPFRRFLQEYVFPVHPEKIGYLAQHDLFQQLPGLRQDIIIPDFCYTSPPSADPATIKTANLSSVSQLDEPLLNAWFGPKGTKTPLHTDPYHNILCQVVGYKYVRLYGPTETPNIYPRGVDENGINMENTSRVDVSLWRNERKASSQDTWLNDIKAKFPLFEHAKYQETILGPGECLYIPLGWWHYVESLSTSFSVSFWWN